MSEVKRQEDGCKNNRYGDSIDIIYNIRYKGISF